MYYSLGGRAIHYIFYRNDTILFEHLHKQIPQLTHVFYLSGSQQQPQQQSDNPFLVDLGINA
jgi:hypothetical protein